MSNVILSICIPTFNNIESLKMCLDYVFQARREFDEMVEVIVSDNCSEDGTFLYLQKIEENNYRCYRNESNLGFNKNLLLLVEKYAVGEYVWTIGDDDFISKESIDFFMKNHLSKELLLLKHKLVEESDIALEILKNRSKEAISGNYYDAIDYIAQPSNLFATFMSCAIFKKEYFVLVDKSNYMVNDWKHFNNVFFNGYILETAFEKSREVISSTDNYIFVVPHEKSWDDKCAIIDKEILPSHYRQLRYEAKKRLRNTSYYLFSANLHYFVKEKDSRTFSVLNNLLSIHLASNIMRKLKECIEKKYGK